MRIARWKVMAGGLFLAAGGLMAMAEPPPAPLTLPPCPAVPVYCPPPAVLPVTYTAPPVAVAAPKLELPPAPTVALPPVAAAPAVPPPAAVPTPAFPPALPPVGPAKAVDLGPPTATTPAERAVIFSEPVAVKPAEPFPLARERVAEPAPAVPPADSKPAVAEKRLRVVLHMGDDRPRFEVRDGDETYLKVTSDRVEVKSAADKADTTLKAAGKVAFVTPGGDGTCDELAILPGSGQVVAVGNVSFRHTWGRSETTVTSERMTFRLAHPGPTAIQAGYTPVR